MYLMEIVSVVIPTHNRSELIENAVKSVLKQTYTNFEIIIVDDASTDNTESIVKSINSEKITYIKIKESRGGNYARNLGAKKLKR
jgi:glycosyltransferase involved in cell wall biosynthesis